MEASAAIRNFTLMPLGDGNSEFMVKHAACKSEDNVIVFITALGDLFVYDHLFRVLFSCHTITP